jgi:hypothetical protein
MEKTSLILASQFCVSCNVDIDFIYALHHYGLIQLVILENERYIAFEQLKEIERAITFHYELNINFEGIDVISNLLKRIENLQLELTQTKNKLSSFD